MDKNAQESVSKLWRKSGKKIPFKQFLREYHQSFQNASGDKTISAAPGTSDTQNTSDAGIPLVNNADQIYTMNSTIQSDNTPGNNAPGSTNTPVAAAAIQSKNMIDGCVKNCLLYGGIGFCAGIVIGLIFKSGKPAK